MDVTVVIGTFGSSQWRDLAVERAVPSAMAQGVSVVHAHAATLHEARNTGLAHVTTEWVVTLDADDELEPGYVQALSAAGADVRAPAVRYIRNGRAASAAMPRVSGHTHACVADCLAWGNWLVVGSLAPTELLRKVGGWRDFPVYEDWDLWVRCWQAGASFEPMPQAIYRAHVRTNSRNRAPSHAVKLEAHRAIARANGLPVP